MVKNVRKLTFSISNYTKYAQALFLKTCIAPNPKGDKPTTSSVSTARCAPKSRAGSEKVSFAKFLDALIASGGLAMYT